MLETKQLNEIVEELEQTLQDLTSLRMTEKLRRVLKFFIIGFFLWKNNDQLLAQKEDEKIAIIQRARIATYELLNSIIRENELLEKRYEYLSQDEEKKVLDSIDLFKTDLKRLASLDTYSRDYSENISELEKAKSFIQTFNENLEKQKLKQKLLEKQPEILQAHSEYQNLYNKQQYFSKKELNTWKEQWHQLYSFLCQCLKKEVYDNDLQDSITKIYEVFNGGEQILDNRNSEFIQKEKQNLKFFENVENHSLTEEQKKAIIVNEAANLLIAGAGSGKTSTLLAKTRYLLLKKIVSPQDLLIIAFNKPVVEEIKKKLEKRFDSKVTVKTFHSLGLDIISKSKRKKPSVSHLSTDRLALRKKIFDIMKEGTKEDKFFELINDYFLYYYSKYKTAFSFNSKGEYFEYLRDNDVRTLKGHLVKSFEECEIANFLFINGINYLYENDYKIETANLEYAQYRPDFYLPDYELYIEHFGINHQGRTAPYINTDQYLKQMEWKKSKHVENGTKLIETFSYEKHDGELLTKLKEKLAEKGVLFNPLPKDKIFEKINEMGRVNRFAALIATFLNLYKSSGKTLDSIKNQISDSDKRESVFLEIFSKILEDYEKYLIQNNEIDFNDMINSGTAILKTNKYKSKFKYVLVDEFQDISQSRFRLLKSLVNQNGANLFCVGDDWQSIYRFTGSDISLMVDFENHFSFSETGYLQETFRFNDKLCEFSTKFIMQNPLQIKKQINSQKKSQNSPISIVKEETNKALQTILSDIQKNSNNSTVFVIGRYNTLSKPKKFHEITSNYPSLKVRYLTAHKSKGLEADYVIIVGLEAGTHGFPCQIEDDPLLNLVLAKKEVFPHAEERRLFYVAMTRAKKHAYLVVSKLFSVSSFVSEIENQGYEVETLGQKTITVGCIVCKTGTIVSDKDSIGRYYCNNFPYCDYKPKTCPDCNKGVLYKNQSEWPQYYRCSSEKCYFKAEACPSCEDGYLIKRRGRNGGFFFGCSNYSKGNCRHIKREFNKKKRYRKYVR